MTSAKVSMVAPRLAGGFFLAVGAASVIGALGARNGAAQMGNLWPVAIVALVIAVAAWTLPWQHLPPAATLALPAAALLLLVAVEAFTDYSSTEQAAVLYPTLIILVLAWVGLTQPPVTVVAFTCSAGAALAYVLLRNPQPSLPLASLLVILPTGAALGETCAWLTKRLHALSARERRRADDLEQLTRLTSLLTEVGSAREAAELVGRSASALFGDGPALVELADPEAGPVRVMWPSEASFAAPAGSNGDGDPATAMQLPLVGSSQVIGMVTLPRGLPVSGDADYPANLARLFASQVGTALQHLQVIRDLGRAAHRDELTGTGNRRHAEVLLEGLRPGDALLVVDLDHFKAVNDTWGHPGGDSVLRALGAYLQTCVRSSDDVARYGGDEFVVLARGAGRDAHATAERLLRGWRAGSHKTTISIGVALHSAGARPEGTLEAADRALYRAKSRGRNQIAEAEEGPGA